MEKFNLELTIMNKLFDAVVERPDYEKEDQELVILQRRKTLIDPFVFSFYRFLSAFHIRNDNSSLYTLHYYHIMSDRNKGKVKTPIKVYLIHLFALYFFLKTLVLIFLQVQLTDKITRLTDQGNETHFELICGHLNDTSWPDEETADINRITDWLRYLGMQGIAENRIVVFVMIVFTAAYAVSLYFTHISYYRELPLNYHGFMVDPIEDRGKLKLRVLSLIKNLTHCHRPPIHLRDIESSNPRGSRDDPLRPRCLCALSDEKSRIRFARLSMERELVDSVRPEILTPEGYKKCYNAQLVSQIFMSICLCYVIYVTHHRIRVRPVSGEADFRSNLLGCNTTSLKLNETEAQYHKYEIDGAMESQSSSSPILGGLLEWSVAFWSLDIQEQLFTLESIAFCAIECAWTGINCVMRNGCHMYQTVWSKQIEKQLKDCSEMMNIYARIQDKISEKEKLTSRERIEKALITTYLNFELYRKMETQNLKHMTFITNQNHLQNSFSFLIGGFFFRALSRTDPKLIFVWTTLSCSIFNMDSLITIQMLNSARRIVHMTNEIVGKSTSCSMETSYITELWRRQVMWDHEVPQVHAVPLFGQFLTQSTLISLNSYAFGIFLYMIQSYINA